MSKTFWNKTPKKKRLSKSAMRAYILWMNDKHPLCQICGDTADDLHHLFYGRYGADKDDKTLISVCRKCHEFCHQHKKESQEKYEHIVKNNWEKFKGETIERY